MTSLTFATRPSKLARWQTNWVMSALQRAWPGLECRQVVITTQGDRNLDQPLPEIGGKGLFTQELEAELLAGKVQAAVHSLKDLPFEDPPGLAVGAIPRRADVRDVLISKDGLTLDQLPPGALVGTSSLRRTAQLRAYRPDLRVEPLRGNVDTRIRRALEGQFDAILLAGAGVTRLGLSEHISQWLPLEVMLPAPGQGALAVQCRSGDEQTLNYLAAIDDSQTRQAVLAERVFLAALGGGCSLPVGAYAVVQDGQIHLQGAAAAVDGSRLVRVQASGQNPQAVGQQAAQMALAQGAGDFLNV
ncbi:MAG: hydroxymethylbilane synthase [Chloroflexi bacterium]|nr:hydroxymethylbilane synthase [Chloroflexota bacterium]